MLSVRWLTAADADDPAVVARVVEVVNRAYALAEIDLWTKDIPRTDPDETARAIRDGQTAVAKTNGAIVGAIRARAIDARTWWFGALGVDPAYGGHGVGRALVDFVEDQAAASGARTMRLEVLAAEPPLEHLDRLARWYERRGYREVGRRRVAEAHPDDARFLTKACDVVELEGELGEG
jgi:ribosomal protein S18 acetylase RimI-like enzyme